MSRLDDAINQAKTDLAAANALADSDANKATKVAAAQATVNTLEAQRQAINDEINDGVRNRLPSAESTAQENERKRIAGILGIPPDQVTDEKLQEVKEAYAGQLSEVERQRQEQQSLQSRISTLETEAERNKRIAENAEKVVKQNLIESAVKDALLAEGVTHETGEGKQSYLGVALEQAMKLGTVDVKVVTDSDGNVKVEGDVTGAAEAARAAKEKYPVFFGGPTQDVINPRRTPRGGDDRPDLSESSYKPNYSIPGARQ